MRSGSWRFPVSVKHWPAILISISSRDIPASSVLMTSSPAAFTNTSILGTQKRGLLARVTLSKLSQHAGIASDRVGLRALSSQLLSLTFAGIGLNTRHEMLHIRSMITSTLPLSRAWLARFTFLFVLMSLNSAVPVRAAQETFWPFNLFPPPAWSLSYTDASSVSVSVPTVGTITSRHFVLSTFSDPTTLPALGTSAVYNNASTRLDSETSLDGGANWTPYTGSGGITLTLRHTNDLTGVRMFEVELSSQNIPVVGAYGAAMVRESPTLASLGQLVVTATNGGFFYRGFVNFFLEVSVDNGANWFAASPAAYLEWSGPAGTPATLSISRSSTTVTVCWRTEASGQYQLQKISALGGANWTDVGSPQAGTGSEVCVPDTFNAATNQFYRVQLSP